MKSVWNDADYQELCARLRHVQADAVPRWGRMTAGQMICHLTDALKMASGELRVTPKRVPIRYPPLKQLIIYWLPFPEGVPTAPELLARCAGDFTAEVQALRRELDAFAKRGPAGPLVPHPAFGKLTPKLWGVLVYRHMDHHLRQFCA